MRMRLYEIDFGGGMRMRIKVDLSADEVSDFGDTYPTLNLERVPHTFSFSHDGELVGMIPELDPNADNSGLRLLTATAWDMVAQLLANGTYMSMSTYLDRS